MATIGIICEYNPYHLGHANQIARIREHFGEDCTIVCLMSGSFVQRGEPAVFDRSLRAKAALLCGANLVLEMPVTASLSSAEGFAQKGVGILSSLCDYLCFGTETADADALVSTAQALLDPRFPSALKDALKTGVSFPAARVQALEVMGTAGNLLNRPNDILAVEYTKAILQQSSTMKIYPIRRPGDYHAQTPDPDNPSASAIRRCILDGADFLSYIPKAAHPCFQNAPVHTLGAGEKAILYRLRTMENEEFEALPYGSEGLWRRLMHACREEGSLEEILTAAKTKRYTRSRLNRMVLCAFLKIDQKSLDAPAPYCRILAFDDRGQRVLNCCKESSMLRPLGWQADSDYGVLENRCNSLYGLFCRDQIPKANHAKSQRVIHYPTLEKDSQ